ncbi:MAG: helix-turn-helix transcriptional regulator [Burkholderiales bacterium]|nr:helix-turn-helix transcriptional regulator [Burkholderiales bacterium]
MNQITDTAQLATDTTQPADGKDPFLRVLGERVRQLRARHAMTRKTLARAARVSERHLANLETGQGNASVMLLRQLAQALQCSIAELVGDDAVASPEWMQIRLLLRGRDEAALQRARHSLAELFAVRVEDPARSGRIAFVGLRGAGKSTLGRMLAEDLELPFVELNRVIEQLAGCGIGEIHALYGEAAYRRYELRALEDAIAGSTQAVISTGGGLVSEPETFDLLLARCFTVWLRASPEEHMRRVIAQGDLRPMAGNAEAMTDLKRILAGREASYARSDFCFDTGGKTLAAAYLELHAALAPRLGVAA